MEVRRHHDPGAVPGGGHLELEHGDAGQLHLGEQREPPARLDADHAPEVKGIAGTDVGRVAAPPAPPNAANEAVKQAAEVPEDVPVVPAVRPADGGDDCPDRRGCGRARALDPLAAAVEGDVGAVVAHRERALGPAGGEVGGALGLEGGTHGLLVGPQLDGDAGAEVRGEVDHEVVAEAIDERAGNARGDRRHEVEPVRGEARAQDGHRDDEQLSPHHPREPREQVLVAHHLGAADIAGVVAGRLGAGEAHEVLDEVVEGDGLRQRADPAGRDHHGQVVHEVADDLEGGGAGTDDDPGAHLGHIDRAVAQHVAGLAAGGEVGGSVARRLQAAEVDDAFHAGAFRRRARVRGCAPVALGKVRPRSHRVDEVVDEVGAFEGGRQRVRVERVRLHDLDARPLARLEGLAAPARGADGVSLRDQARHEVAADVPGCAQDEDRGHARLPPAPATSVAAR